MSLADLEGLSEDVLIYLLGLCDISSVVSISETNRYFHLLSIQAPVWVALVENLNINLLRDPPPDENLKNISTAELIRLAKCAARGPETWVSTYSQPTISREIRIPCELFGLTNYYTGRAQLLPGGEFVVITRLATVQCWHVATGRMIGAYDAQLSAHIHDFAVNIGDAGETVAVVLHTETFVAPRRKVLEIVRFCLKSGVAENVVMLEAPRQTFNGGFWCDSDICGNFAAIVIFQNPGWGLFLMDRAEDAYILIGLTYRPQISLLSGHVVIATPGSAHSIQLIVLNMRSLCAQWRPLLTLNWDLSNWTTLANITPLLSEILVLDKEILLDNPIIRLSVYESPFHFGRYNIRVHAWNSPAPPRSPSSLGRLLRIVTANASKKLPRGVLFPCSLTLPSVLDTSHTWTRGDPVVIELPSCFPDILYSGHALGIHGHVLPGAQLESQISLAELTSRKYIHATRHSGAVSLAIPFAIAVNYYS
ncbi:hypothetical protein C8J57DRAFT_1675342 [Mycena rebaudengoi]|nr:hypothetical protein C8J57DRAFT_1675342 [Mycena rebaudengoi]